MAPRDPIRNLTDDLLDECGLCLTSFRRKAPPEGARVVQCHFPGCNRSYWILGDLEEIGAFPRVEPTEDG